jgi:hypothetical protein
MGCVAKAASLLLMALAVASCATSRPPPTGVLLDDGARAVAVAALRDFRFVGRVAVAAGEEGFNATLDWRQRGTDTELQLRAPLGFGSARVLFRGGQWQLSTSQGQTLAGDGPDQQGGRLAGGDHIPGGAGCTGPAARKRKCRTYPGQRRPPRRRHYSLSRLILGHPAACPAHVPPHSQFTLNPCPVLLPVLLMRTRASGGAQQYGSEPLNTTDKGGAVTTLRGIESGRLRGGRA